MSSDRASSRAAEAGIGKPATDGVPAWQRRDPVAIDPVQYKAWCDDRLAAMMAEPGGVQQAASAGVAGPGGPLPHGDAIQASFGHHDIRGVEAHVGGAATDASRQMGAQAYATGNQVAFASQPDLHLAAHEAAHVVQQRGGVQLKGGVGRAGDVYEQHADAVADAVVRGESAAPLLDQMSGGARATPSVQRFEAGEHQELGNKGSGGVPVELAPGYFLPVGDTVALAGDHFESIDQMRAFAANTNGGPRSRGEIEYARYWKLGHRSAEFDDEAKKAQEKRYWALAAHNQAHFHAPKESDRGKSMAELSGMDDESDWIAAEIDRRLPTNGVQGYRHTHVRALIEAATAGKSGASLSPALAADAFACHYLTDAFSSGHVRTPRVDLKRHWDPMVPMFGYNLIGMMSEAVANEVDGGAMQVVGAQIIASKVRDEIAATMRAKAIPTFGDFLSGALHDLDNHEGLFIEMGGREVHLFGDGQLGYALVNDVDGEGKPSGRKVRGRKNADAADTRELATDAVHRSVMELRQAYERGGSGKSAVEIVQGFYEEGGGMFAAEELVPDPTKVNSTKSPEVDWKVGDLESLFRQRPFIKAIEIMFADKAGEMEQLAKEKGGMQGDAIRTGIMKPMLTNPMGLLRRVIEWTPNVGGGGNQLSAGNASAYVDEATSTPGGIASLSQAQRAKLVKDLTTDSIEPTTPSSADPAARTAPTATRAQQEQILQLLETAPGGQGRAIVDEVGRGRIERVLDFDLRIRLGLLP